MKKTKLKVEKLLTNHIGCRDNDNKLIANFWFDELYRKGKNAGEITAFEFLRMLSLNEFTSSETIRRTRCKLQEENKELRGRNYNKRQGELQSKVRKELGYETY
tara:strand:- start:2751 stop:3062 length:312 start_codon:yes stop_codon:yes gene_type:complete